MTRNEDMIYTETIYGRESYRISCFVGDYFYLTRARMIYVIRTLMNIISRKFPQGDFTLKRVKIDLCDAAGNSVLTLFEIKRLLNRY